MGVCVVFVSPRLFLHSNSSSHRASSGPILEVGREVLMTAQVGDALHRVRTH